MGGSFHCCCCKTSPKNSNPATVYSQKTPTIINKQYLIITYTNNHNHNITDSSSACNGNSFGSKTVTAMTAGRETTATASATTATTASATAKLWTSASISCITDKVKRNKHTARQLKFSMPYSPGSTFSLIASSWPNASATVFAKGCAEVFPVTLSLNMRPFFLVGRADNSTYFFGWNLHLKKKIL